MMRYILTGVVICLVFSAQAQYWFGPKFGFHRTDFIYHNNPEYKRDTFNVKPNYNFHGGLVVVYQGTDKYSVSGEALYERVSKVVKEKMFPEVPVYSKTVYNYLSFPFAFRYNFRLNRSAIHYYIGGGPKISFWLGGSGFMDLDEFDESGGQPKDYRFVFNQKNSDGSTKLAVPEGNRVQYALTLNFGTYMDLITRDRLYIDFRYSFGHSNVGFNRNPDFNQFVNYSENFRYRQNMLSVSVTYLIMYDVALQRKGMSTNRESNKNKKKKIRKR